MINLDHWKPANNTCPSLLQRLELPASHSKVQLELKYINCSLSLYIYVGCYIDR